MANLALFDFDHTLYAKDSLLEFTKFYSESNFYVGVAFLSPWLLGLKLGVLNNEHVKRKYFKYFFGDKSYERFTEKAKLFAINEIPKNLDRATFEKFQFHVKNNDRVIIVTASASEWILPWSTQFGVSVIGTKLQVDNHKLTGKFDSNNCYGEEKTVRIKENINLEDFSQIHVYGNGKGDAEMLKLQTTS